MFKQLFQQAKDFWASLPHQAQAAIIVGVSTIGAFTEHVIEMGQLPHSAADAKHLAGRALAAGAVAAWAFYRTPNRGQDVIPFPSLPPDVPKA